MTTTTMAMARFEGGPWDGAEFEVDAGRCHLSVNGVTSYLMTERVNGVRVFRPLATRRWVVGFGTTFVARVWAATEEEALAKARVIARPFGLSEENVMIEEVRP